MKVQSFQQMLAEYGITELESDDKGSREEMLVKYPYSVILEGGYMELDNLNKWIEINLRQDSINWLFYGKISYDYGFAEYFFNSELQAIEVARVIPHIYTIYPHANPPNLTMKSIGYNENIVYNPQDKSAIVFWSESSEK